MITDGWIKSSQSLITISAFLAGISAALLILVLSQRLPGIDDNSLAFISTSLVLSISLFALASEAFTDALEFSDVSRSIQAVMAHDAAVGLFLLALSDMVWEERLIVATIVAGAFSSYFTKDVLWLASRTKTERYRSWLVTGHLKHTPEKFGRKTVVTGGIASLIAAILAGVYIFQLKGIAPTFVGFITSLAVGYTLAGMIYLIRPDFSIDTKTTMALGTLLMVPALVSAPSAAIEIATVLGTISILVCSLQSTKSRVANEASGPPPNSDLE